MSVTDRSRDRPSGEYFSTAMPEPDRRSEPGRGDGIASSDLRLRAEVVEPSRLRSIETAWSELIRSAELPNVFMSPTVVEAVAATANHRVSVVLVWGEQAGGRRLLGVAAFAHRTLRRWLRVPLLSGALNDHTYLSCPVIAAGHVEPVLHCLFDAVAGSALPKLMLWPEFRDDDVHGQALRRVLAERRSPLVCLDRRRRPMLHASLDASQYFAGLSSQRRHDLRRTRKRLAERGALTTTWHRDPADVAASVEEFVALEASGWKGSAGTALRCDPADLAFTRRVTAELAEQGKLAIAALRLDGRAIAMWVFMRSGDWAFAWKIGYDESLARFGPGMLLLEDCTHAFLAESGLRGVDSCSFDESSFITKVWPRLEPSADLMFDARRGSSLPARGFVQAVLFSRVAKRKARELVKAIGRLRAGKPPAAKPERSAAARQQ